MHKDDAATRRDLAHTPFVTGSVMVRLAIISILLSINYPASAQAGTNEWLFQICKSAELYDTSKDDMRPVQIVEASSCRHYMIGAFQMYNYVTAKQCNLTKQDPNSLTKLFMSYVREHGQLNQPSWITIGFLMDNCFCNKDPDLAEAICPASPR